MRVIPAKLIRDTVRDLSIRANLFLRADIFSALKNAYKIEHNESARKILAAIIKNAYIASRKKIAICQDTGMPIVFVKIGQNVKVNGDLKQAINKGVEAGYRMGSLRNSIVPDPLHRDTCQYSPAVIHTEIVGGNKIKITVLPKGFGCENKSQLKMFKPTAKLSEIKKFVIEAVKIAGADACPPYVVSVGIGGTADYACLLAKKALLKKIGSGRKKGQSPQGTVPKLEQELLSDINKLNIGPMGLGGKTTTLAVNVEKYPTHIAGLPVAVNISCHALRIASKRL
ncbi:MAG: fumarate hydratase [Candidatus Omnitrophota bacterium]|jgi:fumarate hydratase subunit alpha